MQERIKTRWVWNEKLQEHQMVEYGTGKYSFTEEDKISIVSEYVLTLTAFSLSLCNQLIISV